MKFRSSEIARMAYPAVLEELDAAIIILDKEFRVVGINPAGRSLLSGDVGQPSDQPVGGGWKRLLRMIASSVDGSPGEQSLTVANGSKERVFSLRVIPIHDDQPEKGAYIFVLRDITYVKLTAEGLNTAYLRFEAIFKFIHDLRTPLNGILGLAEMMDIGALGPLNDNQSQATERILERSEHLTDLINEFVEQCRSDYEQLEVIQKELNPLE